MPIIQSAKKRVRVARRASVQNAKTKRSVRESVKAFNVALAAKKDTTKLQSEAYSAIDTAAKKGVISKHKAARKKHQLNAVAKAAGTTKVGAKKTAKKAAPAKKPVARKSPAKKATVKKAPVKKSAAKKPKSTAKRK